MKEPQGCHQKIYNGRDKQACGHKTTDVAVVGDESVQKLAHCVNKKKCRTYKAQLPFGQNTLINKRFFEKTDARAADIIKTVCNGDTPEGFPSERPICLVNSIMRNFFR
jgi:hypothetical protein